MSIRLGLIGLPNAGKSTLFNALTGAAATVAPYPFTTISPHIGVVAIPDPRLDVIARVYQPRKVTPAALELVDVAGLVKGASHGEGLGNQFLAALREMDALLHVLREFEKQDVSHPYGAVNSVRDFRIVEEELILADLELLERRMAQVEKKARSGEQSAKEELAQLQGWKLHLDRGQPLRTLDPPTPVPPRSVAEGGSVSQWGHFLTAKPMLAVLNVSEAQWQERDRIKAQIQPQLGITTVAVCAQLEGELSSLPESERLALTEVLGYTDSGLDAIAAAITRLLQLITFFTVNPNELRAWSSPQGTTALAAAGKVHSDMARGFIKAEVLATEDLARVESPTAAKEQGLVRIEGKGYELRDGEILCIRFRA